ncbi:KRE6 [Candida theae]|uniref:KRE6 n=1 Tax=Candida theae TaxID=1198502 RepID=A0AAD5FWP9_9ASCO|nr:KRE6 [Candida theae]KAI5949483.1 KRE6 [Candida theae]
MSYQRARDLTRGEFTTRPIFHQEENGSSSIASQDTPVDPFDVSPESHSAFELQSNYSNPPSPHNQHGRPFVVHGGVYSDNSFNYNSNSSSSSSSMANVFGNGAQRSGAPRGNAKYSHNPIRNENLYINQPPAYDRYPIIKDSEANSITSSNSQSQLQQGAAAAATAAALADHLHNEPQSSSFSKGSDTKYPASYKFTEFSPFGGFPASSFPLSIEEKEPDDDLHNPNPVKDAEYEKNRFWYDLKQGDSRSYWGIVGFLFLLAAAIAVFVILPALTYSGVTEHGPPQTYEILTHYSYPMLSAIRTNLIDPDTPEDALTLDSKGGDKWQLVFSDEFNAEGRTFYEGDDQFFTAPDLHYDATKDLEWYDPDAVTTANGTLTLRLDAFKNHDLFYRSGMVQSWNKMCFTQGRIEISARLPNYGSVSGLWPGLWTMGNLGRPGYLASTEGVWPYSYDSCDAGITPNQSSPDGISYLPGQRLNKCTCPGESHPNRGVGRGAPEIDLVEAEIMVDSTGKKPNNGVASQSLQMAPMDIWYMPDYDFIEIYNYSITTMNTYAGGPFQQAFSATTTLNRTWYERGNGLEHQYQRFGYEYLNDDDNGYLRWYVGRDPTLTVYSTSLHPNGNIGWRRLSKEPMSVIMNLGVSNNWAYIDWGEIVFPSTFTIDYVRVYQPGNAINVGCDPEDFPTYDYIQQHLNIYENANLTSFEDAGYSFPKSSLTGC